MFNILKVATAVSFALVLNSVAYSQNKWEIGDVFSNADGSVQFVVLRFGVEGTPELPALAGQTLIASNGKTEHPFTFASNVMNYSDGCDVSISGVFCARSANVLIATQGFTDLNVVKPDFVAPNGFLFLPSGSVRLGVSESRYDALPTGVASAALPIKAAFAINNAGESYDFIAFEGMPIGINPVIEYYNAGLDDYFLTAFANEIQYLDSGNFPGWQRTGHNLPAWTSTYSASGAPAPNVASVCRLWLGNSHFYSHLPNECFQVSRSPGSVFESQTAFLATLPNVDSGACPTDQLRVHQLWNPRGSSHRLTIETVVREEMLTRGWIAEGYGPDGVAMCVSGNR